MFGADANVSGVAHAIQLALTPVFLITGIAGILNVMTGRLARVIDRGRYLTDRAATPDGRAPDDTEAQLVILERRRHIASVAITMCTLSALLVCIVVATLFLEGLLQLPLKWLAGLLFTGATLALVVGLTFFLAEVRLATRSVRIRGSGSGP